MEMVHTQFAPNLAASFAPRLFRGRGKSLGIYKGYKPAGSMIITDN